MKIPQLHAKYLTWHGEFTLLLKKAEQELRTLEHKKWLYYSGKAPPEDYVEQPFDHKVIKSDVIHWVQVDKNIMNVELKVEMYKATLHTLNEILKQINQMNYNVSNMIKWRTFVNGV